MVFSSITFLFLFLPAVIVLYYLFPRRARNGLLLVASLLFYTWGAGWVVIVLVASIAWNYLIGRQIERAKDQGHDQLARRLHCGLKHSVIQRDCWASLSPHALRTNRPPRAALRCGRRGRMDGRATPRGIALKVRDGFGRRDEVRGRSQILSRETVLYPRRCTGFEPPPAHAGDRRGYLARRTRLPAVGMR